MRILLITPYFHPHTGGSQAYAEELHAKLMEKDPNVTVDVLCYNTDNSQQVEKYRGFNVYRIPCIEILPGQFAIPNYVKLWETLTHLFKKNKYDFINSHTRFFESSWWVPFAARHFKTKSVLTDHCATHPVHTSPLVTAISKFIDKTFVPFILKQYDLVTVTNKATQKFLKTISDVQTKVVYGGVDIDTFTPGKSTGIRKVTGIKKSFKSTDIIVSFVGRMIPSKGPDTLFQASQEIVQKNKHVYFIFAGTGPLYKSLTLKKAKNVFFLGDTNKNDVAKLLSKTDILVHPSTHHEGFPNVLLEASAAGCAILTTSMGGSTEIITKDTGVLIAATASDIKTNIEKLLTSKTKRKILGAHARKKIENEYSWEKIAAVYKKTANTLLKAPTAAIR